MASLWIKFCTNRKLKSKKKMNKNRKTTKNINIIRATKMITSRKGAKVNRKKLFTRSTRTKRTNFTGASLSMNTQVGQSSMNRNLISKRGIEIKSLACIRTLRREIGLACSLKKSILMIRSDSMNLKTKFAATRTLYCKRMSVITFVKEI